MMWCLGDNGVVRRTSGNQPEVEKIQSIFESAGRR